MTSSALATDCVQFPRRPSAHSGPCCRCWLRLRDVHPLLSARAATPAPQGRLPDRSHLRADQVARVPEQGRHPPRIRVQALLVDATWLAGPRRNGGRARHAPSGCGMPRAAPPARGTLGQVALRSAQVAHPSCRATAATEAGVPAARERRAERGPGAGHVDAPRRLRGVGASGAPGSAPDPRGRPPPPRPSESARGVVPRWWHKRSSDARRGVAAPPAATC